MKTVCQLISLEQAAAGMVLAEALLDAHGGVLLPQGATLSEASLASLRRRGIASCSIAVEEAEDPQLLAQRRERAMQRLQHLFRHSAGIEDTPLLLQLLSDYRMRG